MDCQNVLHSLRTRFANRDGVGLVAERLTQAELCRLAHWFAHGCGSGRRLLLNAPIFDTILQQTVEAVSRQGRGLSVQRLLFGMGMALAVRLREHSAQPEEGGDALLLSQVLSAIGSSDLDPLDDEIDVTPAVGIDPISVVRELESLDRRVTVLLRANQRLQEGTGPFDLVAIEVGPAMRTSPRLAFFAGLIAAGVEFDLGGEEDEDDFEDLEQADVLEGTE